MYLQMPYSLPKAVIVVNPRQPKALDLDENDSQLQLDLDLGINTIANDSHSQQGL